jgi:hypothetical protein
MPSEGANILPGVASTGKKFEEVKIGQRVSVYWEDDTEWYPGTIQRVKSKLVHSASTTFVYWCNAGRFTVYQERVSSGQISHHDHFDALLKGDMMWDTAAASCQIHCSHVQVKRAPAACGFLLARDSSAVFV